MNIPALIGIDYPEDAEGKMGIVDGYEGKLIIDPPVSVLETYQKRKEADEEKKRLLLELKGKENVTIDGTKINLYANIGSVADVASVLANDAGGIGLFEANFCIWRVQIIQQRKSSLQHTVRLQNLWQERR